MRIFVTGATGVIGRRVVPMLISDAHQVTAVARSASKRAGLERQGAMASAVDLFDSTALRQALQGHDIVINLATHMPESATRMLLPWSWRENDHVRREGSAALVDAALAVGIGRFIQESFAPIYEDGGSRWIGEDWPLRPVAYNQTVLDAERSAARFAAAGGAGVVLRFAAFYGSDSRVLRDMLRVMRKGWAPIPGARSAYISSISHDDAAAAVVASLAAPGGVYNVTDDEPLPRGEWVDALADAMGIARPKMLPSWLGRIGGSTMELLSRSLRISNAKLRAATRWMPRWPSARDGWRVIAAEWRGDVERADDGRSHERDGATAGHR